MAYPVPDQKATRLVELLTKEVVPFFGVPEALLSDRGTNLLSVEWFNHTLKAMLRKHVNRFGTQWDKYLSGILWAYRNTPHDSTGEKPSFLLFGIDCRSRQNQK